MKIIISMYVTLIPVIFTGILNMIWCKLPVLKGLQVPMDNKKLLKDGNRLFGDNKTWKGFIGYVVIGIISSVLWGIICQQLSLDGYNYFYYSHENQLVFNIFVGGLLGLAYALFELPNSFVKRRIGIEPGKPMNGGLKYLFMFVDQADSISGCCLVVWIFYPMSVLMYIAYVLIGAGTHIVVNIFLYIFHIRKNMF